MSLSTRHAVHRQLPSTCPISLGYGVPVCTIMAYHCSSRLARLQLFNTLDHGLPVYLQTCTITASKLARLRHPTLSPKLQDYRLQVHLHCGSITIPERISKFTQSRPPGVSPNALDHRLQVHLKTRSITVSESIPDFTPSSVSGTPGIPLRHRPEPFQISRV